MPDSPTIEASSSPLLDALLGAAAAAAAVYVFDKLDWFMYEHESQAVRDRTIAARPGGEAPAHVIASRAAAAWSLSHKTKERLGFGIHYALGVGPGAAYGVMRHRMPQVSAGRGALFGLTLFLVQDELVNTLLKTAGKPQDYPWQAHARGLVSHLVYGFVLDGLLRATDKAIASRRSDGRRGASPPPREAEYEAMAGSLYSDRLHATATHPLQ